ncbi:MAG: myxococcus cysteine-rich repeat containing protein [Candidatus Peregrinibacteria bacterium]
MSAAHPNARIHPSLFSAFMALRTPLRWRPPPPCGNGAIDQDETCDDRGSVSGDGCSDVCLVEGGWTCTGAPSVCTNDAQMFIRSLMGLGETEIPTLLQRLQFLSAMFHAEESGDLRYDADANGSIDRADTRMLLDALLQIMSGA